MRPSPRAALDYEYRPSGLSTFGDRRGDDFWRSEKVCLTRPAQSNFHCVAVFAPPARCGAEQGGAARSTFCSTTTPYRGGGVERSRLVRRTEVEQI